MATSAAKKRKDPPPPPDSPLDWRMDPKKSQSDWRIEISVPGQTKVDAYSVHKCMLTRPHRGSEYFANVFNSSFAESCNQKSEIELEEPAARAFPKVLDYLYGLCEEPRFTYSNAVALEYLGTYFQIRWLQVHAHDFWVSDLFDFSDHVNRVNPHWLRTYYEQAKLFHNEGVTKALVYVCCKVDWDDHSFDLNHYAFFFAVTDIDFWRSVVSSWAGKRKPSVSTFVTEFCLYRQYRQSNQHVRQALTELTGEKALSVLSGRAAINLLKIDRQSTINRAAKALALHWNDLDTKLKDDLNRLNIPRIHSIIYSERCMVSDRLKDDKSTNFVGTWDDHFEKLVEFKSFRGDCDVPINFCVDGCCQLGRWVRHQQLQRQRFVDKLPSDITSEQMTRLDNIGLDWEIKYDDLRSGKNYRRHLAS